MTSGGSWAPFKELNHVIRWALSQSEKEAYFALEEILKKHRPDFTSLLQNPAKNVSHRQQVQNAPKHGLHVPGLATPANLPSEFVEEALLLSDILNLNEISSVELLLAGEQHMPRFLGQTRGLVAVLLYYDGHQCLLSSLRCLIQARVGVAWTLGLPLATHQLVMSFTNTLLEDGLVKKILNLLETINEEKEMMSLERGRAVGGLQHRQQITNLIREQRNCLADCLLLLSVQNPPNKDHTLLIINHLRTTKLKSNNEDVTKVTVDMVTVSLIMTMMSCFNIGEEEEEITIELYPLLSDPTFLPSVHNELTDGREWCCDWLCAVVRLSWAVLLREYSTHNSFAGSEEVQDDETLFDEAVRGGAFVFLWQCIQNQSFHEEEYCIKKLHWLLTSVITNMPLKMKDLRNHGDEVAREIATRGGVEGSLSQQRYFEDLMKLLGDLYRNDPYDLCLEFWSSGDSQRMNQRRASLNKFLGLCTDLVPAAMFSSLLHLLTGLSSSEATAYHCFEFLKSNSPSLGGGGASAAISLDHFFASLRQYYLGLRQEGVRLTTPTGCAISPQEVEGLISVLKLIRTIAQLDGSARIVMYENQQWLPVATLFGLVGCSIPRELKAEVLRTLASFARTPDIASSMIVTLENVQVLNTAPTGGVAMGGALAQRQAKEGSIQVELEEIESQIEDYSLTRSFLILLDALTDVPLPPTLGAGHRPPGFLPYLEFVRDSVLLKFDTRSYHKPSEKWQIAYLALQILKKLLEKHEISLDDFSNESHDLGGGVNSFPVSPGHTLLVHMFNDSQLLKKVLGVIDECGVILGRGGGGDEERESLVRAALLALQMIEIALQKQHLFFSFIRQNNLNVMATPLDQLLLGINPRSGLANHYINIASYVCLTQETPELALTALNILISSSSSLSVAKEMAVAIGNNKEKKDAILHGFVEHLEWEGADSYGDDLSDDPLQSPVATVARVHQQVQLSILRLLSLCVERSSPNIAHLLLGYETRRGSHISEVTLQDPGILNSSRTLLHSILSLLHHPSHPHNPIGCHYGNPKLAELCYKVVFQLCSHRDLSTPTLRYLRNNHDFFHVQLSAMPLDVARLQRQEEDDEERGGVQLMTSRQISVLHQQAWLMKTVAIEMKMTSLNQLRSHNQRLVDLLMDEKLTNWNSETGHVTGGVMSELTEYVASEERKKRRRRRKVLEILDIIDFTNVSLPQLKLNYFNQSAVETAITSCDTEESSSGLHYTDVKQLYQMMQKEVTGLRGVGASAQRQSLLEEIQHTLEVVVLRNSILENCHGNSHLFQSWRQMVEISLHSFMTGGGGGGGGGGVLVLVELIQSLLKRVDGKAGSVLSGEVCRVLLLLLSHLSLSASTAVAEDNESILGEIYSSSPLHSILRGLLHSLLHTPGTMQLARAYLYGALLYYFSLSLLSPTSSSDHSIDNDSLSTGNLATIAAFGEALKETVCRDASSGHDVTRMLSLSLLDSILSTDRQNSWMKFLVSRGYLAKLCAGLVWEDEALQKIVHPLPDSMRPLYVHQSRMALLCRLGRTPSGTRELLSANCINYLTQCHFIDLHANLHDNQSGSRGNNPSEMGFVPSISDRYRQLLLPILKLLFTLLTCPGAQGSEVKSKVTSLIGAHSDTFTSILKSHRGRVTMETLEELSIVTGVVSYSGVGQDWTEQTSTALGAGMVHIQRLMLSLLPHYCDRQLWSGLIIEAMQGDGEMNSDPLVTIDTRLKLLQICSNIINYCRVAMTMSGKEYSSPYCRVIFSPDLVMSLSTNQSRDGNPFSTSSPSVISTAQAQSLGHLIKFLRQICDGYESANESGRQTEKKISNWSSLSQEELVQILSSSVSSSSLSLSQQQSLAKQKLKKMKSLIQRELALHSYITENVVYVLWRHLQFYLVHCKPGGVARNLGVGGAYNRPSMRKIDENAKVTVMETTFDLSSLNEGVSVNDIEALKMSIGRCLPSSLFEQLLAIEEGQQRSRSDQVSFIQALVHRIRKLIKLNTTPHPH